MADEFDPNKIFRTGDPRKGEEQSIGQVPNQIEEPRSTLPVTSTDVEHKFWTEQLEPSGKPRTSELLEEVPSFSYKDRVISVSRQDLEALDNYIDLYGESEGRSSVPPRIRDFWTPAGKKWHQDLWDRSESISPNYPLVRAEEPRSTDLVPLAPVDPPQKKPQPTGKALRGIGSLARKRLFPIIQAAQLGWDFLSDDQKDQVTAFLQTPTHEFFGWDKPGIDYFRQMLRRWIPKQGGIAALQDLREPVPVYQSAVARAVDALPMDKGPGEQMLAMVSKSRGVKPGEIEWTGLAGFLKDKKSVTKQEIQDFINANKLRIEEIVRSDDTPDRRPLFEEQTLDGGENYREVSLTLPAKTGAGTNSARYGELLEIAARRNLTDVEHDEMLVIEDAEFRGTSGTAGDDFVSGHFPEKNTLAHIRLNDRTGPNGEKILFVEELQSDWHQTGRERGYQNEEYTKLRERQQELFNALSKIGDEVKAQGLLRATQEQRARYMAADKEYNDIQELLDNRFSNAVPDAPLKKTWHEMTFRRVLRMAAEEGKDSVAWTPGKVQAERYDLSKQVDRVVYHERGEGAGELQAYKGDEIVMTKDIADSAKEIPEIIGKDAAEKLMAQPEESYYPEGFFHELSGQDLQVGGEGMEGFYDKIIKNYANKFGKKFGAEVGVKAIKTRSGRFQKVWNLPITPEMKKHLLREGVSTFAQGGFIDKPLYQTGGITSFTRNPSGQHRPSVSFGDLEYRAELDPELATTPLGQLAYWDIREKTGGDVSHLIKNIVGNPKKNYVYGDHPNPEEWWGGPNKRAIYGTSLRGTYDPKTGIVRANTSDWVDSFARIKKFTKVKASRQDLNELQHQDGGDIVMAHELGHHGIRLLREAGKLPKDFGEFYEEDILRVLDSVGFGTREGDTSPPYKHPGQKFYRDEGPVGTSRSLRDNRPEENHVDYARTATGVMSGKLDELTPYEQELATLIKELNRTATEEIASRKQSKRKQSEAPKVKKAAGGFIDKPLYQAGGITSFTRNPSGQPPPDLAPEVHPPLFDTPRKPGQPPGEKMPFIPEVPSPPMQPGRGSEFWDQYFGRPSQERLMDIPREHIPDFYNLGYGGKPFKYGGRRLWHTPAPGTAYLPVMPRNPRHGYAFDETGGRTEVPIETLSPYPQDPVYRYPSPSPLGWGIGSVFR